MAVGDAYVFPGFLTPALTLLLFPKPPTTFLTCFCRGKRRKYARKKSCLNRDQTHNHRVISPTNSPVSQPGRACEIQRSNDKMMGFTNWPFINHCRIEKILVTSIFSPFIIFFYESFIHLTKKIWTSFCLSSTTFSVIHYFLICKRFNQIWRDYQILSFTINPLPDNKF